MSNLLYRTCSKCLNEGLYFCNICKRHYCEDHGCIHIARDLENAPSDNNIASTDTVSAQSSSNISDAPNSAITGGFRETTEQVLKDLPHAYLASYHSRLFQELKRVQRELERRQIHINAYRPEKLPVVQRAQRPSTPRGNDKKLADVRLENKGIDKFLELHPTGTYEQYKKWKEQR